MVRAVLFDYGLTLVTFSFPRDELLAVLERVRPWLGPSPPEARKLLDDVLIPIESELDAPGEDEIDYLDLYERAWRRAGLELDRATLYRILDLEQQAWDGHVRVAEGALETLRGLRTRGIRTAVVSNAPFPPEMMRRQMRRNGIAAETDTIVLSSEVGRRKPAPELFLAALRELSVAPQQALHVGDREVEDYEGARRAGLSALLCTQLTGHEPPPGVPSISRLCDLLERL